MDNKDVLPTIYNIQNNRVLVENQQELKIYQRCTDSSKKLFATPAVLAEITIPCFVHWLVKLSQQRLGF